MKSANFAFILLLGLSNIVFAHGEDKLGPHGGYIRMPGPFHTEVLALSKFQLKIYLLDIQWQNPTTNDSKIEVKYKKGKVSELAKCEPSGLFFNCSFSGNVNLKAKAKIEVIAERGKQKGSVATYELPLALANKQGDHSNHH